MNNNQKKFFISYSQHDKTHKDNLLTHLSSMQDFIITWNDRDILPGHDWDATIKEELQQADVVLYLVTAKSMATDYIRKHELPLAIARSQQGECTLIPIIVGFCDWQEQDFAKKRNVLPNKGVPITDKNHWGDEDKAWLSVITEIKRIIRASSKAPPPQQAYLDHYTDDVVIHAAQDDASFAETFKTELQKHLGAKLGSLNFRLRLQTGADDFSQAAAVIVLLSENYMQQFGDGFQNLPHIKQKRLILVDVDKTPKPDSLAEVMEYSFCQQIKQTVYPHQATDRVYQLLMGELVIELHDLLKDIKTSPVSSNNSAVFINVAPEDRVLGKEVQKHLAAQYRLDSFLPATTGTRSDIGNRYQHCDAVLFIFVNGSEEWVDNQLLACRQAANEHQKQFKIVAIHTNEQQNEKINVSLPRLNLKEYYCPPETIQDYLPRFVEALK